MGGWIGWTFLFSWIVSSIFISKKTKSLVITIGGGFTVGLLMLIPLSTLQKYEARQAGFYHVNEYLEAKDMGMDTYKEFAEYQIAKRSPEIERKVKAENMARSAASLAEAKAQLAAKMRTGSFNPDDSTNPDASIAYVKKHPCKQGGTVEDCFNRKLVGTAVRDLGWIVSKDSTGTNYIVERSIQIGGLSSPAIWRWSVSINGTVTPVNGKAIGMAR